LSEIGVAVMELAVGHGDLRPSLPLPAQPPPAAKFGTHLRVRAARSEQLPLDLRGIVVLLALAEPWRQVFVEHIPEVLGELALARVGVGRRGTRLEEGLDLLAQLRDLPLETAVPLQLLVERLVGIEACGLDGQHCLRSTCCSIVDSSVRVGVADELVVEAGAPQRSAITDCEAHA
jgi:hypothetical protein